MLLKKKRKDFELISLELFLWKQYLLRAISFKYDNNEMILLNELLKRDMFMQIKPGLVKEDEGRCQRQIFKLDNSKWCGHDTENVDTSLLVWGGYFTSNDQKSNKENRWLVCVNINKQEINIAQHEEDSTVYPFKSVMCVFTNMKYDNALMIFFNNGKEPLHFFCDSEQDRDSLHQLLASVPAGKFKEVP
ncbi:hypothetical protein RFI_28722 [Reticulomyxa filosa]|uniref:Uncharacterized protein n=1 Tax=Reticulomyxa filosa TaxID=46433 RepID=X6M5C2_RETFI|nr:hypothetical protein RFI_28722 [Reticulomyxa filosa]|eukprot:ETO08667.1 hypothetical protein RFI_28722 [Reticulomyxa filosa]